MDLALQRMAVQTLADKQGIERFGAWFEARHVFIEGKWRRDDRFQDYNRTLALQQDSGAYVMTALKTLSLLNYDVAQYLPKSRDIKSFFALSERCRTEPKLKKHLQDLALLHEFGVVTGDARFSNSKEPIKNNLYSDDVLASGLSSHIEDIITPEFNNILTETAKKAFATLDPLSREAEPHAKSISNRKSASGVPLIGRG